MGTLKLEIEMFDGNGNFNIYRKKMKVVLVQQNVSIALDETLAFPETITRQKKQKTLDTTFTSIFNLSDVVLRQVNDETTTHGLWNKLESLS